MKFSVVIPAYNAQANIGYCLESLTEQTYQDFEVVIVNDGSTDSTGPIVSEYARSHDNVAVSNKINEGLLLARRDGLSLARGEYVMFLDADDMLHRDALEKISSTIDMFSPDVVQFNFSNQPDFSLALCLPDIDGGLYSGTEYGEYLKAFFQGKINSVWSRAVRRELIVGSFPFDRFSEIMHGEDLLLSAFYLPLAHSAYYLEDILYFYRPSEQASTGTFRVKQIEDIEKVSVALADMADRLSSVQIDDVYFGTASQYVYLFNILVRTDLCLKDKIDAFNLLSKSFNKVFSSEVRFRKLGMRLDIVALSYLIKRNWFVASYALALTIEFVRALILRLSGK